MSILAETIEKKFGHAWAFFAHVAEVAVLACVIVAVIYNHHTMMNTRLLLAQQHDAIIEYRATTPTRTEISSEFTKLMVEVGRLNGSLDTLIKLQKTEGK